MLLQATCQGWAMRWALQVGCASAKRSTFKEILESDMMAHGLRERSCVSFLLPFALLCSMVHGRDTGHAGWLPSGGSQVTWRAARSSRAYKHCGQRPLAGKCPTQQARPIDWWPRPNLSLQNQAANLSRFPGAQSLPTMPHTMAKTDQRAMGEAS